MTLNSKSLTTLPGRPHDLASYSVALLAMLMVAMFRNETSSTLLDVSTLRGIGLLLWCCHFLRRIAECLWVHRYAGRRVPLLDAIGEYAFYTGFAVWNAWALSSLGNAHSDWLALSGIMLVFGGELGNSWAHLKLRALRPPNTNQRGIPTAGLFNWVSCANYTFELLTWLGYAVATRTIAAFAFLAGVVIVLGTWAKKRHARYHLLFDGNDGRATYPSRRRALIPWLF